MIKEIVSVIVVLLVSASFAAADAGTNWAKIESKKEFVKLDEKKISGDRRIIAYSLGNKGGRRLYYVSLLRPTPQGLELLSTSEVTGWLGSEKPLNVKIDLNYFKHQKKFDIVHLNFWRSLSDSATVSNISSDLFYVIDPEDFSLTPFWELEGSNTYSSNARGEIKRKITRIYVTDNWIYTLTETTGPNSENENLNSTLEYYAFDSNYKPNKGLGKTSHGSEPGDSGSLPGNARKLRQVQEPILAEDLYKNLFYPNGMPIRKDKFWGEEGKTSFQFIKSIKVNMDTDAVLYSENLFLPERDEYSGFEHLNHLAILQHSKGKFKIIKDIDVTDYLYGEGEDYGICIKLTGNLGIYKLSNSQNLLHLSLGKVEAGSGGVWDTSNIFYLLDNNNHTVAPVFISTHDSGGGRGGWCCDSYNQTYIYLADVDSDGTSEILTQGYNYEIDREKHTRVNSLDPRINIFRYDPAEKKFKLSGQTDKLPKCATEIDRVFAVGIHDDSEEDWEN